MTQIEQAIAQIAELKAQLPKGACAAQIAMESQCKDEAYNEAIGILKTLLNEQNHANSAKSSKDLQEPISEDLEDASNNYCLNIRKGYPRVKDEIDIFICNAFKAGAQWQKEKDQKELQIAEEHGILTGMNMEHEKLMKDAVDAVVSQVPCANEIIFRNPASVNYWYLPSEMNRLGLNKGDKVKLIIVKDE